MNEELLEKLEEIKHENRLLVEWQQNANNLLNNLIEVVKEQRKKLQEIEESNLRLQYEMLICKGRINSLPYDILDPELDIPVCKPKILSAEDTLDKIVKDHMSMSRFGDGEFAIIDGVQRWRFQDANGMLGERLRQILQSGEDNDGFLIGLNPEFYENFIGLSDDAVMGVMTYMTYDVRRQHASLIDKDRQYGDALCFRKMKTMREFISVSELWKDRECLFIEGENTGLGVGNSLFTLCKDIQRIVCPAENAFDKYEDILNAALDFKKDTLVLLALGPTASVLSYDLYREGYQAVDVGMLDMQFESVIHNTDMTDLLLPNKYCPQDIIYGNRMIGAIDNPVYLSQVYKRIV